MKKEFVMRDREYADLYQAVLLWEESNQIMNRHLNRIQAIEEGRSNFDIHVEKAYMESTGIVQIEDNFRKMMWNYGEAVGEIWHWLLSIRGIGENLAAKLIANVDYIGSFETVSKLWKYAGLAVIEVKDENGVVIKREAQRKIKGESESGGNSRLKSIVWQITDQFVKQRTPIYRLIYDDEKERLNGLHPDYTKGHIDAMARRKTGKIFLQHFWLMWRTYEGLPTNGPYSGDILGHTNIIDPPE